MKKLLYTGTMALKGNQPGLAGLWLDDENGRLEKAGEGACSLPATFAAVSKDVIYAGTMEGARGALKSFKIDRQTGNLDFISSVDFEGDEPCHINIWPDCNDKTNIRYISCVGYEGGYMTIIPSESGKLFEPLEYIKYTGTGYLNPGRQDGPHIHSSWLSPDGSRLLCCFLGLDVIKEYKVDTRTGCICPGSAKNQIRLPDGEGPRHLTFSADGNFLYVLAELGNKCFVYSYDQASGTGTHIQTISLLPEGWDKFSKAAGIMFSPDGKYLYCSNRGADTIAVFSADSRRGRLTLIQQAFSRGAYPWCFCMDEHYFIAANQEGNCVNVFKRDNETGLIGKLTDTVKINTPSFVGFA